MGAQTTSGTDRLSRTSSPPPTVGLSWRHTLGEPKWATGALRQLAPFVRHAAQNREWAHLVAIYYMRPHLGA